METITVPLEKVQNWQRLLRAMCGQVAENMRPGQSKTGVMFTLENMSAGMDALIADAQEEWAIVDGLNQRIG